MESYDTFSSPLGIIYIIFSGQSLTGISFKKPKLRPASISDSFKEQLSDYFEGKRKDFDQKICLSTGTEFEKKVWLSLSEIPYGETRTYKWIAEMVGSPRASRAVGQALSKNPIPIVLPCHRVIESDGDIGGYSSGEVIKRRLLSLEYYHSTEQV